MARKQKSTEVIVETAVVTEAPKSAGRPRTTLDTNKVVHMLVSNNPKRNASKAAFALYREGISLAELVTAYAQPIEGRKFSLAGSLAWDVAHKYIELHDAPTIRDLNTLVGKKVRKSK